MKAIIDTREIQFGNEKLIIESPVELGEVPDIPDLRMLGPDVVEPPDNVLEKDELTLSMFHNAIVSVVDGIAARGKWTTKGWLVKVPANSPWLEVLPHSTQGRHKVFTSIETTHGRIAFNERKDVATLTLKCVRNPMPMQ